MPATIPTPNVDLQNYPPANFAALNAIYGQGNTFWLTLAIARTMADATTLYTVPTGIRLFIHRAIWDITTGFSGGSSSAIGLSSDATGYTTQGDILGGSGGDVAATLATGTVTGGTVGAKFASNGIVVLPAGKVIRYDKIVSTYTAGAGFVHIHASILPTS